MDVEMEDRLPGGGADVHAEVVAIGLMDPFYGRPGVGDDGHQLRAFLVGGLEPRRHMPARDDQRVARGDGELVPEAEDQAPTMEQPIIRRAAEGACGGRHVRSGIGNPLISSRPESPAATHAAQRHCRTGRHAVL